MTVKYSDGKLYVKNGSNWEEISMGGGIKSIQRGNAQAAAYNSSISITLPTKVNPDKCQVNLTGGNQICTSNYTLNAAGSTIRGYTLTATTLTVYYGYSASSAYTGYIIPFAWEIIEYV